MQNHWDTVYTNIPTEKLGWYESEPKPSLELISRCQLAPNDPILDIGAGVSTLIDHLLARGHRRLLAADLSPTALETLQQRLGETASAKVAYLCDDITRPQTLPTLAGVRLWHDRALLHFLQDEDHKASYLETLRKVLAPGGFVIIAAFSLSGAEMCTGLPVHRYSVEMLARFLGPEFVLLEGQEVTYYQPSGSPRPFVYTRFQHTPS